MVARLQREEVSGMNHWSDDALACPGRFGAILRTNPPSTPTPKPVGSFPSLSILFDCVWTTMYSRTFVLHHSNANHSKDALRSSIMQARSTQGIKKKCAPASMIMSEGSQAQAPTHERKREDEKTSRPTKTNTSQVSDARKKKRKKQRSDHPIYGTKASDLCAQRATGHPYASLPSHVRDSSD